MLLSHINAACVHEIEKIKDQPKEGFRTELEADNHLFDLIKKGGYPYDSHFFAIMKLYRK